MVFLILFNKSQGSVLGQLLFINDLPNSPSLFKFILFADDCSLSTSFAEGNVLGFTLGLSHEHNNVNNWLTSDVFVVMLAKQKIYDILVQKTATFN